MGGGCCPAMCGHVFMIVAHCGASSHASLRACCMTVLRLAPLAACRLLQGSGGAGQKLLGLRAPDRRPAQPRHAPAALAGTAGSHQGERAPRLLLHLAARCCCWCTVECCTGCAASSCTVVAPFCATTARQLSVLPAAHPQVHFVMDEAFKVQDLLQLQLHKFGEDVAEIVDRAQKEEKMETVGGARCQHANSRHACLTPLHHLDVTAWQRCMPAAVICHACWLRLSVVHAAILASHQQRHAFCLPCPALSAGAGQAAGHMGQDVLCLPASPRLCGGVHREDGGG